MNHIFLPPRGIPITAKGVLFAILTLALCCYVCVSLAGTFFIMTKTLGHVVTYSISGIALAIVGWGALENATRLHYKPVTTIELLAAVVVGALAFATIVPWFALVFPEFFLHMITIDSNFPIIHLQRT